MKVAPRRANVRSRGPILLKGKNMSSVVMRDDVDHRKLDDGFGFDRISLQIERILFSAEFIASSRFGATLDSLHRAQRARFGTCNRTARRDLSTMVAVGLVVVERVGQQNIFRVNPTMRFGQLLLSVANPSMEGSVQHA